MQNKFCDCDDPRDVLHKMKTGLKKQWVRKEDVDVFCDKWLNLSYDRSNTKKLTIPKSSPQLRGMTLILFIPN